MRGGAWMWKLYELELALLVVLSVADGLIGHWDPCSVHSVAPFVLPTCRQRPET